LQCFSLVHSLGGGTGSGVGTFLLPLLADEYPHVFRFVTCLVRVALRCAALRCAALRCAARE
jgi:hypothetical protein